MNRFLSPLLGMGVGLIAGLVLSVLYAVIGVGVETAREIRVAPDPSVVVLLPWAVFSLGLPVVILFGIGPAVFFGTGTGALIGLLHAILKPRVTCTGFAIIGFVTCAGISIGVHGFLGIPITPSAMPGLSGGEFHMERLGILVSYPYLMGIPSLVYVVTGTLGSFFLCRLLNRIRPRSNAPSVTPK